jgi:SSS family solute:Na+ symporter
VNPHLLLLIVYSVGLGALGVAIGRRVSSASQFFVSGRALGPGLLCATVLAANIGAGSTVGAASLGYRDGVAGWWWVGSAGVGTLLLAYWLGPRIWRIARDHDLYTVGDFLEWRYGPVVRATTTSLLWVATLTILAAQLVAVAFILEVVADIPPAVGCMLGGAVMTVYFTAGGLMTSAWVNLVQLVVLVAGIGLALPWALAGAGGVEGMLSAVPDQPDYLDVWRGGASGWNYIFLLVPAFVVSPGLLQKVYGARDAATVRKGVGWSGLALLLFAPMPALLGMMAHAHDPTLVGRDINLALPIVLTAGLPLLLGGLGLAAVFSAEVSSADAILFMLSTSLSEDLYKRFLRPEADDRRVLAVARIGSVAGGVLGTGLAILLGSVIESMTIFYSLLGVSLFVPVVMGIHRSRAGSAEAMAAIVVGVLGYLAARYGILGTSWIAGQPNLAGLLLSAAAFASVAAYNGRRSFGGTP